LPVLMRWCRAALGRGKSDQYWSPIGSVLVTSVSSTGHHHLPVLVTMLTSTGCFFLLQCISIRCTA